MQSNSPFVKIVIWIMIFLMSVGFAALVIVPFAGNSSLFGGGGDDRSATQELLQEARSDVKKDDCANPKKYPAGKRLKRCKVAIGDLAAAYRTLATPPDPQGPDDEVEVPKDAKDNTRKATEMYKLLYDLDPKDRDSIQDLAGWYRDQGKAEESIPLWETLVKRYPDQPDYVLSLAGAQQGAGKTDEAKATFRSFLTKFPDRESDVEGVKAAIQSIEEQEAAQAAGGGAGGQPITVG